MADVTDRLNYFDHQFMRVEDFSDEQSYHLDRRRRHNRLLHTWGIAPGGLTLTAANGATAVTVQAGTAIDSDGREIVLAANTTADLAGHAGNTVFVVISYGEKETDPTTETGVSGNRRVTETPVIAILDSAPANQGQQLILGRVTLDKNSQSTGTLDNGAAQAMRRSAGAVAGDLQATSVTLTTTAVDSGRWPSLRTDQNGRISVTGSFAALSVAGNVGIGTAGAPAVPLEVNGQVRISGNNNLTMGRALLMLGRTDGSKGTASEIAGAIGFVDPDQSHAQLSYRASKTGATFELVDRSGDPSPDVTYAVDSKPYADLKVRNLTATGTVTAATVAAGTVTTSGNLTTTGTVTATTVAAATVTASGRLTATGTLTAATVTAETLTTTKSLGVNTTKAPAVPLEVNGQVLISNNSNLTMGRALLLMGRTDDSTGTGGEIAGAIGFVDWNQSHAQISYRAGDANTRRFELVDRSGDRPDVNYAAESKGYAHLKLGNLTTTGTATIAGNTIVGAASGKNGGAMAFDVAGGRMRVRASGGASAGIWFCQPTAALPNGSADAAYDRAFVGMVDDNIVGFWGRDANAWGLQMHVKTLNLGVGMAPTAAGVSSRSGNLLVAGDAYKATTGTGWGNISDRRVKKGIEGVTGALDRLTLLRGVSFEWRKPEEHGGQDERYMGLVAQEVEDVMPEWVITGDDGTKFLNMIGFEAMAIEAIKELKVQVEAATNRAADLEKQLLALGKVTAR